MTPRHHSTAALTVDGLIAAAARDAAVHQDKPLQLVAAPPEERAHWAGVRSLVIAWAICSTLTLFNFASGGLGSEPPRELDLPTLERGLRITAELTAVAVEEYRAEHGVLPPSLDRIDIAGGIEGQRLERLDGGEYRIVVRHGDQSGVFDSRAVSWRKAEAAARQLTEKAQREARIEQWASESADWIASAQDWAAEARNRETPR